MQGGVADGGSLPFRHMHTTLAVDIGGTKVAAALVADDGTVDGYRRRPTRRHAEAEELFSDVVSLVSEVAAGAQESPDVIGVGCGGPMTSGGETVSPLNIPAWRDFPLRRRLAEATGRPVHVDNDAKALALAEGWLGAARGCDDYIAMVVSTGVGGGIVSGGRLLDGAAGNAGHVGHVYVSDDPTAWDGHPAGLLETLASGLAIEERTGRPAAEAEPTQVEAVGRWVGRGVASVANLLDLRLAVVAGSVALGFGDAFFSAAQREIDRLCVLDHSRGARIVPAGLGERGPIVGAAAVGFRASGRLDFG